MVTFTDHWMSNMNIINSYFEVWVSSFTRTQISNILWLFFDCNGFLLLIEITPLDIWRRALLIASKQPTSPTETDGIATNGIETNGHIPSGDSHLTCLRKCIDAKPRDFKGQGHANTKRIGGIKGNPYKRALNWKSHESVMKVIVIMNALCVGRWNSYGAYDVRIETHVQIGADAFLTSSKQQKGSVGWYIRVFVKTIKVTLWIFYCIILFRYYICIFFNVKL